MERIDIETQGLAVEKVIEEMNVAEEFILCSGTSYWEHLSDAESRSLSKLDQESIQRIEKKNNDYYDLSNIYNPKKKITFPLRKESIEDGFGEKYRCKFGSVDWIDVCTKRAIRDYSFHNNGLIEYQKKSKGRKGLTYKAIYNVLEDGLDIGVTVGKRSEENENVERINIILKNELLREQHHNIEIIRNTNTGWKSLRMGGDCSSQDKSNTTSISLEAEITPDNTIASSRVDITSHNGSGKIIGTYRLEASMKKGIHAIQFSKKGAKTDISGDKKSLKEIDRLLQPIKSSKSKTDQIIAMFANYIQGAIAESTPLTEFDFEGLEFINEIIPQTENRCEQVAKQIQGESPLPGLYERIDHYLDTLETCRDITMEGKDVTIKKLGTCVYVG